MRGPTFLCIPQSLASAKSVKNRDFFLSYPLNGHSYCPKEFLEVPINRKFKKNLFSRVKVSFGGLFSMHVMHEKGRGSKILKKNGVFLKNRQNSVTREIRGSKLKILRHLIFKRSLKIRNTEKFLHFCHFL